MNELDWEYIGYGTYKHITLSDVYMDKDVIRYNRAIQFIDQEGNIVAGGIEDAEDENNIIYNSLSVTLPFTPKTFKINVIVEYKPYRRIIKDMKQLEPAYKYYKIDKDE